MKVVLTYWLYRSRALTKPRSLIDGLMYLRARDHNAASEITGYLHRDEAVFVQYIEGPATALKALRDRICVDGRHRDIQSLECGVTRVRRFTAWDMAFTQEEIVSFRTFQRACNESGDLASASGQDLLAFMDVAARDELAGLAA